MSKLGVLLGSDSYTTVYDTVFDGDDEKAMTELMDDAEFEMTEHTSEGRFTFEQTEDNWAVGQVFETNGKPFALIWHHAYDGVDFELIGQFDSYEDALAARDEDIKKTLEDFEDPFNKAGNLETWNGDRQAVFDTGEEWWVWSILEVNNG